MTGKRFTIGERFGRLVLTGTDRDLAGRLPCMCDCGTEKRVHYTGLRAGKVQSCGCLRKLKIGQRLAADVPQPHRRDKTAFTDPIGFIAARIIVDGTGCWLWQGAKDRLGYGRMAVWNGERCKSCLAHRFSYQTHRGPIPDDRVIDHLCRVPGCVNPDHMELVSRAENNIRGIGAPAINARKQSCHRGHPLAGDNLLNTKRGRVCRACNVINLRARRSRADAFRCEASL